MHAIALMRKTALVAWLMTALGGCAGRPENSRRHLDLADRRWLGVALTQPLVTPGDVAGNIDRMAPLVADAARRGARLVVFSECGLTGYDLKGRGVAAALAFDDPALDRVGRLARDHGVTIVAGLFERDRGVIRNTAIAFRPDGTRVVQRKHRVMPPEAALAHTEPAPRTRTLVDVDGFRCALVICSDAGIPGLNEELAGQGCDLVVLITAGAGDTSFGLLQRDLADPAVRAKYAKQAAECLSAASIDEAIRLRLAFAACNQSGYDAATGYYHPGGSSLIDRTGAVAAVIPPRWVFEHLRPDLAVGFVSRMP